MRFLILACSFLFDSVNQGCHPLRQAHPKDDAQIRSMQAWIYRKLLEEGPYHCYGDE